MRLFRIRKAKKVPAEIRQTCEQFGPNVIAHMLAVGDFGPKYEPLRLIAGHPERQVHALAWLTEQYDRAERKEYWSLIMEIAITLFVLAELLLAGYDHHWGQWIVALPHRIVVSFGKSVSY